jgi:hypothetical protein
MLKLAVTAVTVLLGGAAVGVAVHVQTNPRAFTTLETPWLGEIGSVIGELEVPGSVEAVKPLALTLDEVTVWGDPHRMAKMARAGMVPEPEPVALRPCSEWWELDPQANVRMLCQ